MLVLSRKKNQVITINHDIRIMVVAIHGDRVTLGIEAPKAVPVHRREVYDTIHGIEDTSNSGEEPCQKLLNGKTTTSTKSTP